MTTRRPHSRRRVIAAIAAIVVVLAGAAALRAKGQQSKIDDLTHRNQTLTAEKAQAIRQREVTQQELNDRAAKQAAADAEATRVEAMRPPGATLFTANCASCHGITGDGGIGPPLSAGRVATHLDEAQAVAFVTSGGSPPMPTFGTELSPAQIKQVVAYVLNL